jgi:hypothetical protein
MAHAVWQGKPILPPLHPWMPSHRSCRVPAGWQPDAEDGPKLQEVKKKVRRPGLTRLTLSRLQD